MNDEYVGALITDHSLFIFHSVRNDFTGFDLAAFIAWKLTVTNEITKAINPAAANTSQFILMR